MKPFGSHLKTKAVPRILKRYRAERESPTVYLALSARAVLGSRASHTEGAPLKLLEMNPPLTLEIDRVSDKARLSFVGRKLFMLISLIT